MKIYKFKEFLKLKDGIIFSYFEPMIFDGLFKKVESWDGDFIYQELIAPIKSNSSDEMNNILIEAKDGSEIELDYENDNTSREGLFDEKQLYAVYSDEDIKNLIKCLK